MFQPELFDYLSYVVRLFTVERLRFAFADGTEAAASGADISQQQESGRVVFPTLADVGATGLLTYRVKIVPPQNPFEPEVIGASRESDLDPIRMSSRHSSLTSE